MLRKRKSGDDGYLRGTMLLRQNSPETHAPWRILVCGGRDFTDRDALFLALDVFRARHPIAELIHGGARGADTLAGEWAIERGLPVRVFQADWEALGRPAGPIRNLQMLTEGKPDVVVAFPGGRGTLNMIEQARSHGVRVELMYAP